VKVANCSSIRSIGSFFYTRFLFLGFLLLHVVDASAQIEKEGALTPEITEDAFSQIITKVSEQYSEEQTFVLDTLDGNNRVTFTDAFLVYSKGAIHHPIGQAEMKAELVLEDQILHYSFSGFLFHSYKRNRYGRYVPANLKATPFEFPEPATHDDQKAIQKATGEQITLLLEKLKNYMP
jgi:hypothetical protein